MRVDLENHGLAAGVQAELKKMGHSSSERIIITLAGIMINILRGAAGVGSDWLLTFSLIPDLG